MSLQVVALLAGCDALQVAGAAGVEPERRLEAGAIECLRVCGEQILEYTALERQELGAKKRGIKREQLFQYRLHADRAASGAAVAGDGRAGCSRGGVGLRRVCVGCGDDVGRVACHAA